MCVVWKVLYNYNSLRPPDGIVPTNWLPSPTGRALLRRRVASLGPLSRLTEDMPFGSCAVYSPRRTVKMLCVWGRSHSLPRESPGGWPLRYSLHPAVEGIAPVRCRGRTRGYWTRTPAHLVVRNRLRGSCIDSGSPAYLLKRRGVRSEISLPDGVGCARSVAGVWWDLLVIPTAVGGYHNYKIIVEERCRHKPV